MLEIDAMERRLWIRASLLCSTLAACAEAGSAVDAAARPADAAPRADAPAADAPAADAGGRPDAAFPSRPLLNEFVADHAGLDESEFIEVFGAPDTDYSDHAILVIEGDVNANPGAVDAELAVGTTDGAGYFATPFSANVLENGSLTLLLVLDYANGSTQDIDADDDGVIDDQTWTATIDAIAVVDTEGGPDLTYAGGAVLAPDFDGLGSTAGGASRIPDGVDTDADADWVRNDDDGEGLPCCAGTASSGEALNTPGAPNQVAP